MRIINDSEEKQQVGAAPKVDLLSVLMHALFCALGISTVLFAPLPMIGCHLRLPAPWSKVAIVGGGILAVGIFEAPLLLVLLVFVFGLYASDGIERQVGLWRLLAESVALAGLAGLGSLVFLAQNSGVGTIAYWEEFVSASMKQFQAALGMESSTQMELLRSVFFYEGPFFYLCFAVLSVWLSIALAAHLEWFPKGNVYSGAKLRGIRLPRWLSIAFVCTFLGVFQGTLISKHIFSGLFRFLGTVLFVQGCIFFSELLARRSLRSYLRTGVYTISVLIGFYALVGLGVMGPWVYSKSKRFKEAK